LQEKKKDNNGSSHQHGGMTATVSMQLEVDAATTMYHQEVAMEEQQEAGTIKPNMIAAGLFTAVELVGSMEVKQQVVTVVAHDYRVMG
jgi:hypothetical protein